MFLGGFASAVEAAVCFAKHMESQGADCRVEPSAKPAARGNTKKAGKHGAKQGGKHGAQAKQAKRG